METIVCGVDGSAAALEAARQAAALAGAEASLTLIAVTDDVGCVVGAAEIPADDVLAEAKDVAAALAGNIVTRSTDSEGRFVWDSLLQAAAGADLLVLARSRSAMAALERAELPVLVATAPPEGLSFPGRILVAADGPGHPEEAVRLAAQIAQPHGSDVLLVRSGHAARRPELVEAMAELREITGADPIEVADDGQAEQVIADYAKLERASLVITGSRGQIPFERLRSVSQRLARSAPCSVLVIRVPPPDERGLPYA